MSAFNVVILPRPEPPNVRTRGKPRAFPVSTSTSTLMPARSGGKFLSLTSTRTRIGMRCNHLDPVAAGVLCRQQRKLLRRGRADALHHAFPPIVRIGIDRDGRGLPGTDVGQLGFLRICNDPHVIGRNEKNAVADAWRYLPGAIDGTSVTIPANGALTMVWASCRAASSRCETASR